MARDIVGLSLTDFSIPAAEHADRVRAVTAQLEQRCRDEAWTPDQVACITATTGKPCDALGADVGGLTLAHMRGVHQDNVAAALITDPDELIKEVQEQYAIDRWPEDQRRCFAAATVFDQIILCRMNT